MSRTHKNLEGLQPYVGQEVFVEIRGGTPVVPSRREIALDSVRMVSADRDTVTLQIPIQYISTISGEPITMAQRRRAAKTKRASSLFIYFLHGVSCKLYEAIQCLSQFRGEYGGGV